MPDGETAQTVFNVSQDYDHLGQSKSSAQPTAILYQRLLCEYFSSRNTLTRPAQLVLHRAPRHRRVAADQQDARQLQQRWAQAADAEGPIACVGPEHK